MEILLNPNFLSGLVSGLATVITGLVAITIYFIQKKDAKTQAARVLLMEIRTAEERIAQIKEKVQSGSTSDLPPVFPTKSWKTYSHLFISDFDQDELRLISSFYDYGDLIEDFSKRNNEFFWVTTEERARVVQQKLAELLIPSLSQVSSNTSEINRDSIISILDNFSNDSYSYAPQKTINAIKNYTEKIGQITTTSAGNKLKELAVLRLR